MSFERNPKRGFIPSLSEMWQSINSLWCKIRDLESLVGTSTPAVSQYSQVTIQELRDADVFTQNSFIIIDEGLEGLFVYDADDTTSTDDGITVLVKDNKRYIRKDWRDLPYFIPVAGSQATVSRYLKTGNTYYGLISQYTGREITVNQAVTKINGDPSESEDNIKDTDIDNIVYFKFADGNYGIRNWENGVLYPEEFGAKPDAVLINNAYVGTDCTAAFQKMFDSAPISGVAIELSAGKYIIRDTIKPKLNNDSYKIILRGKGEGVSYIVGAGDGLIGKNLLELTPAGSGVSPKKDSNIRIHDIEFHAKKADMCIYANKVIFFRLDHCALRGGEEMCLKVGDDTGDNYLADISDNYFNTVTVNGGQNTALMEINSFYAKITKNTGDGGFYALKTNLVQSYISGNIFEGYKFAGIYSKFSGGGGCEIIGNNFRPYSLYDPNGLFNGEMHGIYIESITGGVSANVISGNEIIIPAPENLNKVVSYSIASGLVPEPQDNAYKIVGVTSGATGRLVGWNQQEQRLQIEVLTGTFQAESIIQGTTNGTAIISSLIDNHTYGISLLGNAGSNVVTGNRVEGCEWSMQIESADNSIVGNKFQGIHNGLLIKNNTHIIGNSIALSGSGSHVAAKRIGSPVVKFEANSYGSSTLENIDSTLRVPADVYGKNFVSESADVNSSFSGFVINVANKKIWGLERVGAQTGSNDGSNLTLSRFADDGTLLGTTFKVDRRYGYFDFQVCPSSTVAPTDPSNLTRKDYVDSRKAASSPTTALINTAVGSGNPPTQAEFNALVDNYNKLLVNFEDLKDKMIVGGILSA